MRHRGVEAGDSSAKHSILWLHGYTGSPDAFAQSAERFARELDASVSIPLLPGHGTDESHLPSHTFDDFLSSAKHYLDHVVSRGKPYAIIGYSFGSYLATILAAESDPEALVLAIAPYRLRLPFRFPGFSEVLSLVPYWGKHLNAEDVHLREGTFYYPHLPGRSLSLMREGNERIESILPYLKVPILALNNDDDPLAHPSSGQMLLDASGGHPDNMAKIFPHDRHTFFMGPDRERDEEVVIEFLKRQFEKNPAAPSM